MIDARRVGCRARWARAQPGHLAERGRSVSGEPAGLRERARVAFADSNAHLIYGYDIELLIHHPTDNAMRVPSLLGRNIMDRWRVTYDESVPELVAEVVSSAAEFPA